MKIAQVCPAYRPSTGGVETHVEAISERLAAAGHEVDVLTTDPTGRLANEEVVGSARVVRFKSWAPGDAYYFSGELRDYLRRNSGRYEVVHAHSYHAMPALYASQSKSGNLFVFTPHYHGTGHTPLRRLLHVPWKRYARRIFERADRVISVSDFERALLLRSFRLEGKVVLVPEGLDLREFESRRPEKRHDGTVRVLCVSRLEKYKGVHHLIACLPQLPGNFTLDAVGTGPSRGELEREAGRLGVSGRVRFHGRLPRHDLLALYRGADVFALLSEHEAYGIAVAEALASGLPCVVSRAAALSEWVDDRTCFGVDDPADAESLAGLIANVARLGAVTRGGIADWGTVAEATAGVYRSIGPPLE